ncbi:MAG: Serine-protein kinase RsbW [Gemmatimonadaceae bacterium]|nr:Serine-protein kinase RsbW [Gemmatimonadaceae bacterium]
MRHSLPDRSPLVPPDLRFPIDVRIPSDLRLIEPLVGAVIRDCAAHRLAAHHCALNVPVALTEALSNAILYGNLLDRAKYVRLRVTVDERCIVFEVTDEGSGFDLEQCTTDPTTAENVAREDGRGLFLMRCLMDRVERYTDGGNVVRLTLLRL